MKRIFKNRYFLFGIIYLCLLSVVGLSLSFSRFTSGDTQADSSDAAVYNVVIRSGDMAAYEERISITAYATSNISEPLSFISGVYDKKQINIINNSSCDVQVSQLALTPEVGQSNFELLAIAKDKEEMAAYENACGGMSGAVLDSLDKSPATASQLSSAEAVRTAVSEKTNEALAQLDSVIKAGEAKTFYLIGWVEHDSIYKADAALYEDGISHKALKELGIGTEYFKISLLSQQVD